MGEEIEVNKLTAQDLQAVAKAFGYVFRPEEMFQIAANAEKQMMEDAGYRWTA